MLIMHSLSIICLDVDHHTPYECLESAKPCQTANGLPKTTKSMENWEFSIGTSMLTCSLISAVESGNDLLIMLAMY